MASKCFNHQTKGVILDITGVLKNGNEAIKGSVDAIKRLNEQSDLQLRFCTNETSVTRRSLVESLQNLGFAVEEKCVFSPIPAMCKILKQNGLRPHLLVNPKGLPDFCEIDKNNPNCVVIGDALDEFSYQNVNKAFQCLMNMETPLLYSLGRGKYYLDHGELTLDVGAYKAALEYAVGVKAEVVGKPSKTFYGAVLQDMGVSPSETIMVGDDIVNDIGGAQECGMRGVQVRTGKFRPSDENHPTVKPDAYVDNLAHFVDLLLANKSNT